MNQPLLERRSPIGVPYALLILMAFFFLLPSVFRAARLSLGEKQNEVKDWLPSDFLETSELEWFGKHFIGESFVLATWPGCTSGDQRLSMLEQKLRHESDTHDPSANLSASDQEDYKRAAALAKRLELICIGSKHQNWGGLQEKWIRSAKGQWYYLTPDGRLFRWDESLTGPAAMIRSIRRGLGGYKLEGQFVTAFGQPPTEKASNAFYNDPSLVCAPLFHHVQTGDSVVDELASKGGPLWPKDLTDESKRAVVARRMAMERLTGTLFAPAVPNDFGWTAAAFRQEVSEVRRDQLPENFDFLVEDSLNTILDQHYDGSLEQLMAASTDDQATSWYTVFDSVQVEPPPRLTCVHVTLTEIGQQNLAYVLGRGVGGGARGRLLQLAEESGVRPAPPPSLAPPPFNRPPVESFGDAPSLRLGGPPVDNIAIDEEGTVTLIRLLGYSVLVGIVLSYFCFRSFKITLMVFICGGSAATLSMAMVWWTGGKVDAILMSMPSLVYVLGLSGAIHVVNYYRDEVRSRGESGAVTRAVRHAIVPCSLASVTTAIGLATLFTSNLAPISNFGIYSAIGVLVTLGILFSYLPAALQTFLPSVDVCPRPSERTATANHPPSPEQGDNRNTVSTSSDATPVANSLFAQRWASVGRFVTTHYIAVSTLCLVTLAVAAMGLFHIRTSVQLLKLFDEQSRIIRDYAWLEDHFGKLVPMELIVRVPASSQAEQKNTEDLLDTVPDATSTADANTSLNLLQRAEVAGRISKVVEKTLGETGQDVVGQAMSIDTFLPPLPAASSSWGGARSIANRDLLASRDQLLTSDYLRVEQDGPFAGSELWRISLRVGALSDVDYGRFISTLRTVVEPVLRAYDTRDAILSTLAKDEAGNPIQLTGKERLMIVGHRRPASIEEAELLSEDQELIDTEAIYLATLGELLAGERLARPVWVDVFDPQSPVQIDSDRWLPAVEKVDAVVWVDQQAAPASTKKVAKRWVNARAIMDKTVEAAIAGDQVPMTDGSGAIEVIYTGVIPVVYKAQRTLLYSLVESIALAFVLIAIVMMALLNPGDFPSSWFAPGNLANGFLAGSVAMIPNVFPVLLVFGIMCHLNIAIDIGTMMTASVAMGVAVDDTIHFLSWFRVNLNRGLSRVEAVIETYRRVGPAMTQTTIVGGLGLFIFALSTFTPTQRFGTLMLAMLAAALVGDLIMLPALLVGPLGRFFKPRAPKPQRPDASHADADHSELAGTNRDALPALVASQPTKEPAAHKTTNADVEDTTETNGEVRSDSDSNSEIPNAAQADRDGLPHLKIHFPPGARVDSSHPFKRK